MNPRIRPVVIAVFCPLLLSGGLVSLAPATARAQPAPRGIPSYVRTPDVLPPVSSEITTDGGSAGNSPGSTLSLPPLFMKTIEAGVDAGEEALKGTARARALLSTTHKDLTDARKVFKHSKDDAARLANVGEHLGILDKIADNMSVAGAASSAFAFDDQGRLTFHPEHFDGIGVAQEATNNWLSGMAVYYGAKAGALAGAEFGAMTGIPILVLVGGTAGGLIGGLGTSMLYNDTGKVVVDGIADRATELRGSQTLEAVLTHYERQLESAKIMFGDGQFKEAERSAKAIQHQVSSIESKMVEAGIGTRAQRLKFAALELQGRVARLRLQGKSAPAGSSSTAELRPAAPKAATQMHFQKLALSNDADLRRQAQVTGVIDLEAQTFHCTVNGALLEKGNSVWATFQIDFTGPCHGDDNAGAFSGNTSFRIRNRKTGKSGTPQNASIKGEWHGRMVKLTITTKDTVDEVSIPVQ